ncbi:biotin-dependent carboxyltransferase family protein [Candidatus Aciduliprofundum boonei]|uniref:Urea amidolyase related protein n=1 Tax=Aciduliprofundum boonei (strain DSM 19572 / T469) TaxID=439481 RepID=B5ICK0_ACIB4|nr:biotin-dependent carboxyltransferase family protein [Candidatus Aciduliprofundum boonei]ADD09079.1 urea amidolyase related protein [Aciduliprofundum boonei T469]EDY36002.1 biotin-dependent carboxylase uncharacterized domain, putative [Aciduliprofundum boonei T469]HII55263.1 biotin-dependent carboxyltransferase [Candidatus Aciduliprofundum boonei]
MIKIIEAAGLSIQDLGREGYQKYGVPVGGVMDRYSAVITNYLVGNEKNAPLLEFFMGSLKIKFLRDSIFAVGANSEVKLNGEKIEAWEAHMGKKGDVLEISQPKSGVYGYLSFQGGLKCQKVFGSCSTYPQAGWGRYLKKGEVIELKYLTNRFPKRRELPEELIPKYDRNPKIRLILGPQLEHFSKEGIRTFLSNEYIVTEESSRMGYRLDGPRIEHSEMGADIISDAIPLGSIQVPESGKPIIMLADHQTTGGYAKIGVVISADISKVAQTPIGGKIRFQEVSVEKAQMIWKRTCNTLQNIKRYLEGKIRALRVKVNDESLLAFVEEI